LRAKTQWNEADKTAVVISDGDAISVHDIGLEFLASAVNGQATIAWIRNGVRRQLDPTVARGLYYQYIKGCENTGDRLAAVLAAGHVVCWDWLIVAQIDHERKG